ncbi:MAG: chemotaxis protein CheW [Desulfarculaceae bacterium]|nr:chemotaxis protein CheW [Desulfarculaceae bacterium]
MAQLPTSQRERLPWVILRLGRHHLALSTRQVREMTAMPAVTPVPGDSPLLRGMIDLRGELLPLMDLRRVLGLPSLEQEMARMDELLARGEREHRAWLEELTSAADQGRRFAQPLAPEECAFGRWYAAASPDDPFLISHMAALDAPHCQAHEAAAEVSELLALGLYGQARELLARHQALALSRLPRRIQAARQALREAGREIAVVADNPGGGPLALAVDEVVAVEEVSAGTARLEQADLGPLNRRLLAGVGQRPDGEMVFLLEADQLLAQGRALAAQA